MTDHTANASLSADQPSGACETPGPTPEAVTGPYSGAHEAAETNARPANTARRGIFNVLTGRAVCPAPRPDDEAEGILDAYAAEVRAERDTEDLASADSPTRLRWGLNDVLWGDDDSVIVLMSDENGRPYWLELDGDRAGVLGRDLAQHGGTADVPEPGTCPCGHDDYHDPHEWAERPGVWCPGISYADDKAVQS